MSVHFFLMNLVTLYLERYEEVSLHLYRYITRLFVNKKQLLV